jgi:hypothetical protein
VNPLLFTASSLSAVDVGVYVIRVGRNKVKEVKGNAPADLGRIDISSCVEVGEAPRYARSNSLDSKKKLNVCNPNGTNENFYVMCKPGARQQRRV